MNITEIIPKRCPICGSQPILSIKQKNPGDCYIYNKSWNIYSYCCIHCKKVKGADSVEAYMPSKYKAKLVAIANWNYEVKEIEEFLRNQKDRLHEDYGNTIMNKDIKKMASSLEDYIEKILQEEEQTLIKSKLVCDNCGGAHFTLNHASMSNVYITEGTIVGNQEYICNNCEHIMIIDSFNTNSVPEVFEVEISKK